MFSRREGLLVRHKEYMVDRLNDEIEALRNERARLQMQFQHQERERAAAEILLCLIMFAAGFLAGWALL